MSASQYMLDLVISSATFAKPPKTPVWLVFKIDGLDRVFDTRPVSSVNAIWNMAVRIFLTIKDVSSAYLYVKCCAFNPLTNEVESIAVSKVNLKSFPVRMPKSFNFPLMDTRNTAIKAAQLSLTASLSTFIPETFALTPPVSHSTPRPSDFEQACRSTPF